MGDSALLIRIGRLLTWGRKTWVQQSANSTRWGQTMRGLVLAVLAVGSAIEADAQPKSGALAPGRLTDEAAITRALAQVPFNDRSMDYRNLGERFERIGLRATRIDVERLTAADEKDDPGRYKRGDLLVTVLTSQASEAVNALCPIGQRFQLVKRGAHWMPQDRTANWLVNGHGFCRPPS